MKFQCHRTRLCLRTHEELQSSSCHYLIIADIRPVELLAVKGSGLDVDILRRVVMGRYGESLAVTEIHHGFLHNRRTELEHSARRVNLIQAESREHIPC